MRQVTKFASNDLHTDKNVVHTLRIRTSCRICMHICGDSKYVDKFVSLILFFFPLTNNFHKKRILIWYEFEPKIGECMYDGRNTLSLCLWKSYLNTSEYELKVGWIVIPGLHIFADPVTKNPVRSKCRRVRVYITTGPAFAVDIGIEVNGKLRNVLSIICYFFPGLSRGSIIDTTSVLFCFR